MTLVVALACAIGGPRSTSYAADVPGTRNLGERILPGDAKTDLPTKATDGDQTTADLNRTITTQQRINRYFHGDVIPKLKSCWGGITGAGWVAMKHTYVRSEGKWRSKEVAVKSSTLAQAHEAVALRCMQNAVRGSGFPTEEADGTESKSYVVHWTWPVPLPSAAQTRTIFTAKEGESGKEGCDGRGAVPACIACTTSGECKIVCVGFTSCQVKLVGSPCENGEVKCASGGAAGVAARTLSVFGDRLPKHQLEGAE